MSHERMKRMSLKEKIQARKEKKEEKKAEKKSSDAITQKNIEESREEILAKGKKFKYPFQYAKHRLMFNTILIGLVAIAAFVFVGWYQLYKAQSTSEVVYRFTKVFGLSVAEIDNIKVRFSDYLMLYRSSITSVERQQGAFDNSDDSKQQKEFYKRQALNLAEDYSFAMAKLAEANDPVTNEEIDEVIENHKLIDGEKRSNEAFEGIVHDNFGLSMKDYRRLIMLTLAKKKASIKFDEEAKKTIEEIKAILVTDSDFEKVAKKFEENDAVGYEIIENVESTNLDNGRAEKAASLEKNGDISDYFVSRSGDGYYIVKLIAKEENKVSYASISVRFNWVDDEMAKLRKDGHVKEKIDLNSDKAEEENNGSAEEAPAENN